MNRFQFRHDDWETGWLATDIRRPVPGYRRYLWYIIFLGYVTIGLDTAAPIQDRRKMRKKPYLVGFDWSFRMLNYHSIVIAPASPSNHSMSIIHVE